MEVLLSDNSTYFLIKLNSINKILNNFKELLKRWKLHGYITNSIFDHLNKTKTILPRAYGLSKTHKVNNPLRIIISSINSLLHNFALFLHKIIHSSLTPLPSITLIIVFIYPKLFLMSPMKKIFI